MSQHLWYIGAALILGACTATVQGFNVGGRHWVGAAVGGPALGLALGSMKYLVRRTSLRRCVLFGSVATLAVTLLGAQCAMCVFVAK